MIEDGLQKNMMVTLPVALFVYNRPLYTRQTIESLKKNKLAGRTNLYIFSDGPKGEDDLQNVQEVRRIIQEIQGFNQTEVVLQDQNIGLANSIIFGVSEVLKFHEGVIVLEDDLISSSAFLNFMNQSLFFYREHEKVFSVTGFNYPSRLLAIPDYYAYDVYFSPRPSSWGWGTWKWHWEKVDWTVSDFTDFKKDKQKVNQFNGWGQDKFDMLCKQQKGLIDSWAIRWDYHHFKHGGVCVYPIFSYINNIGFGDFSSHTNKKNRFRHQELNEKDDVFLPDKVSENKQIKHEFTRIYKKKTAIKWLKRIRRLVLPVSL